MEWVVKSRSILATVLCVCSLSIAAEPMPSRLVGTWKITRVLPTRNVSCWDEKQAQALLGTRLEYRKSSMRWHDHEIPVLDVIARSITADEFIREGGHPPPTFKELGIRTARVTEVDLQHDDADITGASTEVPGDTVLLAAPNRIVVTACGVYYEAVRAANIKARH
jgi:hypothetical protein